MTKKLEIQHSSLASATRATATKAEGHKVVAAEHTSVLGTSSSAQIIRNPQNVSQMKQALADHQLTIHNLKFEKKQVVKERDDLERLLSDAEARNFELRDDINEVLQRSFSSIEDLKREIKSVLAANP